MTAAEAAKVTLEKEPILSQAGELVGYQDFAPTLLTELTVTPIADYDTYLAGEVAEAQLPSFVQSALACGVVYTLHPDFDLIQVNGYTFSSFGEPTGLPPDLAIAAYDGLLGLYLVQLKAPPTPEWLCSLQAVAEIVSYFPQNTYVVRVAPAAVPSLRSQVAVQHVSLFQPAFKVRRSLLELDRVATVDLELDAGQELGHARAFLDSLAGSHVDVRGDSLHAYARLALSRTQLAGLARRPEVLWVEPALPLELSDERQATVVAGRTTAGGTEPDRFDPDGHQGWLRSKGFCTPSVYDPGCRLGTKMVYWTKVGVVDSGLDNTICLNYDPGTGVCSQWSPANQRHPDLNHASNLSTNCPAVGEGIEDNNHCDDPVIRDRFFCSSSAGGNQCLVSGTEYNFADQFGKLHDPEDPPEQEAPGHGTTVASIISGDPLSRITGDPEPEQDSSDYYRGSGIAPSAQLIVARYTTRADEDPANGMQPVDFHDLVGDIYTLGEGEAQWTRFTTNSWNLKAPYDSLSEYQYTLYSKMADQLVRDALVDFDGHNSEMTLVFSGGNYEGGTWTWVTSPGNAKNVISVGAMQSWSEVGGNRAHDYCADEHHSVDDVAGGADIFPPSFADFHSRRAYVNEAGGGAAQPRYKPDLVAPGTQLAGARSAFWWRDPLYYYRCFQGTSAAAPAVAASAVLAETWYYYKIASPHAFPSPAMVKALLVAHAEDMSGAVDPLDGNLPHSPSVAQGWGRVNLDRLFQLSEATLALDEDHASAGRRFTASGQYWSAQLRGGDPSKDIIAVMVYTDRYSEPGAGSLTVNDLDLKLFKIGVGGPGHTYWGNYFETDSWYSEDTAGQILPSPPEDTHNTVEVIRVPAGVLTSTVWIRVRAKTVAGKAVPGLDGGINDPNQDFALYVYNATLN